MSFFHFSNKAAMLLMNIPFTTITFHQYLKQTWAFNSLHFLLMSKC